MDRMASNVFLFITTGASMVPWFLLLEHPFGLKIVLEKAVNKRIRNPKKGLNKKVGIVPYIPPIDCNRVHLKTYNSLTTALKALQP